jgi:hypothetical protein
MVGLPHGDNREGRGGGECGDSCCRPASAGRWGWLYGARHGHVGEAVVGQGEPTQLGIDIDHRVARSAAALPPRGLGLDAHEGLAGRADELEFSSGVTLENVGECRTHESGARRMPVAWIVGQCPVHGRAQGFRQRRAQSLQRLDLVRCLRGSHFCRRTAATGGHGGEVVIDDRRERVLVADC